jgi:hypothetical protein
MTEDSGAQLAWRFDASIVAEADKFKPGDPVIVIYRQIGPGPKDKRVTAIAFPGSAKAPIYVNMTSDRVVAQERRGRGRLVQPDDRRGQRGHDPGARPGRDRGRVLVLRSRGRDLHARHQVGPGASLPGPVLQIAG